MVVVRCSSSAMMPLWVGSRCWTMTKAMPLPSGTFSKKSSNASSPPAEAPMPTTGKAACKLRWPTSSGGVPWGSGRASCGSFEEACFRAGLTGFFTGRLLTAGQLRVAGCAKQPRQRCRSSSHHAHSLWRGTPEAADGFSIAIGGANSIASCGARSVRPRTSVTTMLWQTTKDASGAEPIAKHTSGTSKEPSAIWVYRNRSLLMPVELTTSTRLMIRLTRAMPRKSS